MTAGTLCTRNVVTVTRDTTVSDAAKMMRKRHVGDVVVVDRARNKTIPVGIITDRDIVISVVAPDLEAQVFTVGDMLLKRAIVCKESDDAETCLRNMRDNAIRRMPVVDKAGALVGIVSVDDLVGHLSRELTDVAKLIRREQAVEKKTRV